MMFEKKNIWWNIHEDDDVKWLTDSRPLDVYKCHQMVPPTNKIYMEIGIGRGKSIEFNSDKNKVIAVDICQNALDRVSGVSDTYLTENMGLIQEKTIDVVLCHLVFQHCNDEMVEFIIKHSIRTLKNDGVFHFQFANSTQVRNITFHEFCIRNDIMHFRNKEVVVDMVNRNNGIVKKILPPVYYEHENITWYMFRVTRSA